MTQLLLAAGAGLVSVIGLVAWTLHRTTPEARRHFDNPNVPYGFTHWR